MARSICAALLSSLGAALTVTACASGPARPAYAPRTVQAAPAPIASAPALIRSNTPIPNPSQAGGTTSPVARALGVHKVGKPYQIAGVWYVPAEQPDYDAVGTASWYGDAFHGRPTANGESFDMTLASAAHPTLPLPSVVEVTNLENDRSIQVRVNDRGPCKPGRISDLSRQAADQLGFRSKGVAQVRVRYVGPAPIDPFLPTPGASRPVLAHSSPKTPQALRAATAPASAGGAEPSAPIMQRTQISGFAVQAGAFANRGNAERAAAALGAIGPTRVQQAERDGGVLYRVLVGAWPARDAAAEAVGAVAQAGFPDARIVTSS